MSVVVHSAESCSDRLPVWRQVLGVFKLRIGFLIMLTALAGLASTRGPWPEGWRVTVLALAVLVAAALGVLIASARFGVHVGVVGVVLLGASAAVAEALSPKSSDNVVVPAVVWGLTRVLL